MVRRLTIALLLLAALATLATAQDASKCTCRDGQGSYLYLKSPRSPPADPDPCPSVYRGIHPHKSLPKPWNNLCWQSGRMSCFLRRHAASWNIACSICGTKKCCPFPNWRNCPECQGEAREPPPDHADMVEIAAGQKKLFGRAIEVARSDHFLVVSDLKTIKIALARGGSRGVSQHEILHLYLQRAEMARRDFEDVFGSAYSGTSCMVLVRSKNLQRKIANHYVGTAVSVVKGYGTSNKWPGSCGNGFFLSGKNDDKLHFAARHMIGHLLMSTYAGANPQEKYLPQWIDKGCAHWLTKLHPRAGSFATFCQQEGVGVAAGGARGGGGGGRGRGGGAGGGAGGGGPSVGGSGTNWPMKARKVARRGPKKDPVEAMFTASTAKQMNYEKHVRAWSWFDVFTREERDPFVDFIQRLRRAEEPRVAAKAAWGQAPEIVDDRWREFVLGKRRSAAATAKEKERDTDLDAATSRELNDIATETDLQLLASRIRGLENCKNVKTARLLIALVDSRRSERVREVIALIFRRTDDDKVLAYMRGTGFKRAGKLGRATLLRSFGARKDEQATQLCRNALSDSYWLVRANAARALSQIGDAESVGALARMAAAAANPKLRIAAMDALATFPAQAEETLPMWERNLMNRAWQVKVATCDAFRAIGSTKALDMLIGRLDAEGGRVRDEINRALKSISGLDREMSREEWRKWWAHTRKFEGLDEKMRKELEKQGRPPSKSKPQGGGTTARKRTKRPTYYGIRVYARTVGFVLDISQSMQNGFQVSQGWQARLGRTYKGKTRIDVCKEELTYAIRELDPRTRLNVYFFNTRARAWQSSPVPAGTMGSNAISAIQNIDCKLQTNYYDALRLVLGLKDDGPAWRPDFADTPDTLFFLTDGSPTDGEITKTDELLSWFNERNRFARLRVHVVAMGSMGVALEFLPRFAKENGGTFIHVTGTH